MGERNPEGLKKIGNLQARNICFSKKRKEIMKEAQKLSKKFNINTVHIAFSPAGKPHVFCTDPNADVDSILDNFLNNRPIVNPNPNSSSSSSSDSSNRRVSSENQVENDSQPIPLSPDEWIKKANEALMKVDIDNLSFNELLAYKLELEKLKSQVAKKLELSSSSKGLPIINTNSTIDASNDDQDKFSNKESSTDHDQAQGSSGI